MPSVTGCLVPARISIAASLGKNPLASATDMTDVGSVPGLGRSPRGRQGNQLQYSYLENTHGLRSLVGYSL